MDKVFEEDEDLDEDVDEDDEQVGGTGLRGK